MTKLQLYSCKNLNNINVLKKLTNLVELDLRACDKLTKGQIDEIRKVLTKTKISSAR